MEPIEEKREEQFKKLIRETGTDEPSAGFARAVMQRVHEEVAFRTVMQRNTLEAPSNAFSIEIMARLRASQPVAPPKPVIARKVWYGIAAAWAVLVIACFFVPDNDQQTALWEGLNGLMISNAGWVRKISTIPQTYTLTIIGMAGLLLLDYFVRQRWIHNNEMARS
nr:hypothetical protein [uncultured Dyadobacter sp.]